VSALLKVCPLKDQKQDTTATYAMGPHGHGVIPGPELWDKLIVPSTLFFNGFDGLHYRSCGVRGIVMLTY